MYTKYDITEGERVQCAGCRVQGAGCRCGFFYGEIFYIWLQLSHKIKKVKIKNKKESWARRQSGRGSEKKREAQRCCIAGLGGHSAYQEAPAEVISRGSWRLCTPSIPPMTSFIVDLLSNLS